MKFKEICNIIGITLLFVSVSKGEVKEKTFTLYSEDSLFSIESHVESSGGNQHGSKGVTLSAILEDLPDTLRMEYSRRLLPIFKTLYTVSSGDIYSGGENIYLAIGWSSGGGGYESFEGWLISQSMDYIDVIDRFKLFKLRSYPDIVIDTSSLKIAVTRVTKDYKMERPNDRDSYSFTLTTDSEGRESLLKEKGKIVSEKDRLRFISIPRPFIKSSGYDEIVRIIEITPDGFRVKK